MNNQSKTIYPYVVVRIIPAVYSKSEINFITNKFESEKKSWTSIFWEGSVRDNYGNILADVRAFLIEIVKAEVKKSGYRMCLVFAADDREFIELDGSVKSSNELRSMSPQLPQGEVDYSIGISPNDDMNGGHITSAKFAGQEKRKSAENSVSNFSVKTTTNRHDGVFSFIKWIRRKLNL